MNNVIIIEDDPFKTKLIIDFLKVTYPEILITAKNSYNSGVRALLNSNFDLLILDMSMPTFSEDFYDSEKSFEKFAGIMILKELKRKNKLLPTVLFTMFDDFGSRDYSMSLGQVSETINEEFSPHYWGSVYFESSSNNWMTQLKAIFDAKNFNS